MNSHSRDWEFFFCAKVCSTCTFLLSLKHKNVRLTLADRTHSSRQCSEILRDLELLVSYDLAVDLGSDFQSARVRPPRRARQTYENAGTRNRIVLAVERQISSILGRATERKSVPFVGADLKEIVGAHGKSAFPGSGKTPTVCRSLVQVVHGGRSPVRCDVRVIVTKDVTVLGERPLRGEEHAAIFLAHDLPVVRPLIRHGQHATENAGLKRTVHHDPLGGTAKIELVRVAADVFDLHLVDEFASGRVQLPIAD